jgi:hypothetical protein
MNEQVRRQLKVLVERCVRPIQAANFRKDRMRRELLSHLTDVYAQERLRSESDRPALAQALARFGDVRQVRYELQATVPPAERFLFRRIDLPGSRRVCPGRQPHESALRYVLRRGVVGGIAYFLLMSTAAIAMSTLPGHGAQPFDRSRLLMLVSAGAVGGLMIVAGLLLNHFKVTAMLKHGCLSLRSLGATLLSVVAMTSLLLVLLGICNAMAQVPVFPLGSPTLGLAALGIVTAVFESTAVLSLGDRQRSDEWESLSIEPQSPTQ